MVLLIIMVFPLIAAAAASLFCAACGSLLPVAGPSDTVQCLDCDFSKPTKEFENIEHVSQSREYAFQKPKYQTTADTSHKSDEALISEECPSCGNPEMSYYSVQLRSVDEGQTIFYTCPKCQHKFTLNS